MSIPIQALEEILKRQETEAKQLLADPFRFVLTAFDLEIHDVQGNHQVIFDHDEWSCSCSEHSRHKICSHIIAAEQLMQMKALIESHRKTRRHTMKSTTHPHRSQPTFKEIVAQLALNVEELAG